VSNTTESSRRAVVIGSGFGGLTLACRLQAAGVQVTLLEKREKIGGRAYQLVDKGDGGVAGAQGAVWLP